MFIKTESPRFGETKDMMAGLRVFCRQSERTSLVSVECDRLH